MTTTNIINTLRQGVPVTARLVREIIAKLERLEWAESSLKTALEKYADTAVSLTADETGWICAALDDHARLKAAVTKMLEYQMARDRRYIDARAEVDRLLEARP